MTALRRRLADLTLTELIVSGACTLIVLLLIHYISINRGNLPYLDEWYDIADVAVLTARGELTFDVLTSQWNEHRPLITNLITAGLTLISRYDLTLQQYLHVGFALLLYGSILGLIGDAIADRRARRAVTLWTALPIALLIFAVTKRQVWLWPYLIVWTQGLATFTFGLWLVRRLPVGWAGVLVVIIASILTTYSLIYGFAAWPLLSAALWQRGYRRPIEYLPIGIAFALVTVQFFTGFDWSGLGFNEEGHGAGIVTDPVRLIYFILANLGNPFFPFSVERAPTFIGLAAIAGAIGIALFAVNAWYLWRYTPYRPALGRWAIFVSFASICVGAIALGRAAQIYERPHYPLAERYSQPASLLWVALLILGGLAVYHIVYRSGGRPRLARALLRINVIALASGIGLYSFAVTQTAAYNPYITPEMLACAIEFPRTRNVACFPLIGRLPVADRIARINDMAELRLAIWRDHPPPYERVMPLAEYPFTVLEAQEDQPTLRLLTIQQTYASMMLVMPGTSAIAYRLDLPDAASIRLRSAALLDLDDVPADTPLDGVTFRIAVQAGAAAPVALFEHAYMPGPTFDTLLIDVPLDAYRGQPIDLILMVDGGAISEDNRAVWIDPRLEIGAAS
jgi:hypothetical protein